MKPIPLRLNHHADFDHIFTFSNGLRMRELSHYDQILKQLKGQRSNWQKVNADVNMISPNLFHDADVVEAGDDKRWPMIGKDVAGIDQ
jgi:hypothetical protein